MKRRFNEYLWRFGLCVEAWFTALVVLFICVGMLSIVGCGSSNTDQPVEVTASVFPPEFQLGDKVVPKGGKCFGIVTAKSLTSQNEWKYTVMFNDWSYQYNQSELTLMERFDWSRTVESETATATLNPNVPAEQLLPEDLGEIEDQQ